MITEVEEMQEVLDLMMMSLPKDVQKIIIEGAERCTQVINNLAKSQNEHHRNIATILSMAVIVKLASVVEASATA